MITKIVLVLAAVACCTLHPLISIAQDRKDNNVLGAIYAQWDSAVSTASLSSGRSDISIDDLRRNIRYEMSAAEYARADRALSSRIAKRLVHAAFAVRVAQKLDEQVSPDSVLNRGDTLIPVYPAAKSNYIEWIIGYPDGTMRLLYRDNKNGHRVIDRKLARFSLKGDALAGIRPNYHFFTADPAWASLVNVWTGGSVNTLLVYGLHALGTKTQDPSYQAPPALQEVARIVGTRFGY